MLLIHIVACGLTSKDHKLYDEMVGWHHWCNGRELGQTLRDEGQGSLVCCSSRCRKESDMTWWLNNNHHHIVAFISTSYFFIGAYCFYRFLIYDAYFLAFYLNFRLKKSCKNNKIKKAVYKNFYVTLPRLHECKHFIYFICLVDVSEMCKSKL